MKMAAALPVFGIALCLSSLQSLTAAEEKQQITTPKATFLVIYRPGPAWLAGKSISEQPLKEHGTYMLSLYVQGLVKLAGPLTDDAGGAVLLEVVNESAAKAIVTEDPPVKYGIFVYEMQPWELKLRGEYSKKIRGVPNKALRPDGDWLALATSGELPRSTSARNNQPALIAQSLIFIGASADGQSHSVSPVNHVSLSRGTTKLSE